MYISETNASERCAVERVVDNCFLELEATDKILNLLFDAYFDSFPQKELSASEAAAVGGVLHSVIVNIDNILLEYCLTIGRDTPAAEAHMESMRRAEAALKVSELSGRTLAAVRSNESMAARRVELLSMPDEQAAAGLEALLGETADNQ